jgi:dTDP-4-dehydrorhamnose reductase
LQNKTLLIGGSSFIGRKFIQLYGRKNFAFTYFNNRIEGGTYFNCVENRVDRIGINLDEFSHAIIMMGETDPVKCFNKKSYFNEVNVKSIKSTIKVLMDFGLKVTFTSSQYIFDGKQGNYDEESEPNPILLYGVQKLEVENFILNHSKDFLIFRLPKVYGDFNDDSPTMFTSWINNLSRNEPIRCSTDQTLSPIHVLDVCHVMHKAMTENLIGIYHLSSNEHWNRFDLLKETRSKLSSIYESTSEIKLKSINQMNLPETYPLDVSLNSTKILNKLNYKMESINSRMNDIILQFNSRSTQNGN